MGERRYGRLNTEFAAFPANQKPCDVPDYPPGPVDLVEVGWALVDGGVPTPLRARFWFDNELIAWDPWILNADFRPMVPACIFSGRVPHPKPDIGLTPAPYWRCNELRTYAEQPLPH